MEIADLRQHWETWGRLDPFWAILSVPHLKNGKADPATFFASGERRVRSMMYQLETLGIRCRRERALDFGCGVGRLTQALCAYFEECYGVDIAESMIAQARESNRHGTRCRYFHNRAPDLRLFEDEQFDFVNAWIVLQHMQPAYAKRYLVEFLRVLRPGGVLCFQLPSDHLPEQPGGEEKMSAIATHLPASAMQAHIEVLNFPRELRPGSQLGLRVLVKNTSCARWPALGRLNGEYQIKLGSRWRVQNGDVCSSNGTRTVLPADLAAGGEVELPLLITAPAQPGRYTLEAKLLQEGGGWFGDSSTEGGTGEVEIVPNGADAELLAPEIQMHGVPVTEVAALLEKAGGRVLDVRPDAAAGEHFSSFSYVVRKAA